jgi:hypothetical protein
VACDIHVKTRNAYEVSVEKAEGKHTIWKMQV